MPIIITMKKTSLALLANCLLLVAFAQPSKFNPRELFGLNFYPYPGNEVRSANGTPGPKYWQNHADYKIAATLDTLQHKIAGTVDITYTNNSPDELRYLWLQLDQNIYRNDSRSTGTSAPSGGRFANRAYTHGQVIKSITLDVAGKKYFQLLLNLRCLNTAPTAWDGCEQKTAGSTRLHNGIPGCVCTTISRDGTRFPTLARVSFFWNTETLTIASLHRPT
jgi:hypothetical protein